MKNRSLRALTAMFVLGALAQAQRDAAPSTAGFGNVQQALDSWRADHGANWQMAIDETTGYGRFLYGGGAAPIFTPRTDADFLVLARQVARDTYSLHGIEVATLVDDEVMLLPLSHAGSSDKMTVQFRQMINGVQVEGGFLNVLFDRSGRVLSVDTTAIPKLAGMLTSPAVSSKRAGEIAADFLRADTGLTANFQTEPELVIFKDRRDELMRGTLAWKVSAQYLEASGEAVGFDYTIDASNGRKIDSQNAIHTLFDVTGNVKSFASPGTKPDEPSNVSTPLNVPGMLITSAQGNAVSDANGDFNIVGATAPVTATFRFNGAFCNVTNSAGAAYTTAVSLTQPSGNNVVMNSPAAPLVTAQANGFIWANKLRDWTRAVNPADNKADFLNQANVNIASSCNAYFNGSSTNFYQAGGGCVNTCYADVMAHETGHWLNVKYSSGNGNDGFGEGNGDNFALYLTDQPILGADFQGVGSMIRTGNNNRQFCGDANPGCYGEVHNDGEPLMGAFWKMRVNLKNSLGASAGAAAADVLFNSWMNAYNDTQIKVIVETHIMTLDDDDANLTNGTPNFTAIESGFRVQGWPPINLPTVSITNVTNLPDTTNTITPYTVNADVTALMNPPITTVQLKYRLNGGGWLTTAMGFVSGTTYSGSIPAQACPNFVEYYVLATNSGAQSGTFPATSPGSGNLDFTVGTPVTILSDNFQTDQGWVTSFVGATAGMWQRGVPVNDGGWAYDPAADGDGSGQCFLTQNTLGNSDVDGGSVTLTSPTLDMSSNAISLSYRYYLNLTNTNGADRLLVEGNNNNGVGAWTQIAIHTANLGLNWSTVTLTRAQMLAAGFTPTATSKVRFTANDGGTASVVESGVDAVIVSGGIDCPPSCPAPISYCTAKVNSLGCVPAIGGVGTASATAASGFTVFADGVRNNKPGLCLYTIGGQFITPFQGGYLCLGAPVRRTPGFDSGGNPIPANDCSGVYSIDMNAFGRGLLGGIPIPELSIAGTTVDCQLWGRDNGFPSPDNTTLSDAMEYVICP